MDLSGLEIWAKETQYSGSEEAFNFNIMYIDSSEDDIIQTGNYNSFIVLTIMSGLTGNYD